jgi:hypothetical protein
MRSVSAALERNEGATADAFEPNFNHLKTFLRQPLGRCWREGPPDWMIEHVHFRAECYKSQGESD